jgi:hypothetical protein
MSTTHQPRHAADLTKALHFVIVKALPTPAQTANSKIMGTRTWHGERTHLLEDLAKSLEVLSSQSFLVPTLTTESILQVQGIIVRE